MRDIGLGRASEVVVGRVVAAHQRELGVSAQTFDCFDGEIRAVVDRAEKVVGRQLVARVDRVGLKEVGPGGELRPVLRGEGGCGR